MHNDGILILTGNEIRSLLSGRENDIIRLVEAAYRNYAEGESVLPHSTFLRFPDNEKSRLIVLPAYLGDEFKIAGVKSIASFPANIEQGMDRASATLVLNSALNGRPVAMLEGSVISAKRTAAGAALAARYLHREKDPLCLGLVGCGPINYEIARFLLAVYPRLTHFIAYDLDPRRISHFKNKCRDLSVNVEFTSAADIETVLTQAPLVSFATTAPSPYVHNIPNCSFNRTILHVSLRDLAPEVILSCENIVDDIDHVCRAQTSIHLTEHLIGNRNFIEGTLSEYLHGDKVIEEARGKTVVFSPFGLGALDLAVGKFVYDLGVKLGLGAVIESFIPDPWNGEVCSY